MEVGLRPYGPDWHSLAANEKVGSLKMIIARKDGEMIGYMCWMLDFDIEAFGVLIAQQGAWYVRPGNYGVALRMFDWAMQKFRELGVQFVYLHNAERGRGQTLGKFFLRRGAVHTSNVYTLKL